MGAVPIRFGDAGGAGYGARRLVPRCADDGQVVMRRNSMEAQARRGEGQADRFWASRPGDALLMVVWLWLLKKRRVKDG